MTAAKQSSIVLPDDLSERVREKVRSGQYASEAELIAESLTVLEERDAALESWIDEQVAPAYDAWKADPSRATPIEDAFARLKARIAADRSDEGQG